MKGDIFVRILFWVACLLISGLSDGFLHAEDRGDFKGNRYRAKLYAPQKDGSIVPVLECTVKVGEDAWAKKSFPNPEVRPCELEIEFKRVNNLLAKKFPEKYLQVLNRLTKSKKTDRGYVSMCWECARNDDNPTLPNYSLKYHQEVSLNAFEKLDLNIQIGRCRLANRKTISVGTVEAGIAEICSRERLTLSVEERGKQTIRLHHDDSNDPEAGYDFDLKVWE